MAASVGASRVMSMAGRAERALRANFDAYSPPRVDDNAPPHTHGRV